MSTKRPPFTVTILGKDLRFVAASTSSLLEAARAGGIVLPSSCRNGTCRTCLCIVREGRVGYRIAWPGLSREEKAVGYILPCVAYAESDLVLDAPAASRVLPVG